MRRLLLALFVSAQVALPATPAASAEADFLVQSVGRCLAVFNLASLAIKELEATGGQTPEDAQQAASIMERSYERLSTRAGDLPAEWTPQILEAFDTASAELKFNVTEDLTRDFLTLANQCNVAFGLLEQERIIMP